jgi:hypothetical protein
MHFVGLYSIARRYIMKKSTYFSGIQIFFGDFPLTKNLFFKNSGKTRRFSFNKILIFQKFRQN